MHLFSGLAFCSPLHPRVPRNLRARPPRALRSVGLDSSTLATPYRGLGLCLSALCAVACRRVVHGVRRGALEISAFHYPGTTSESIIV